MHYRYDAKVRINGSVMNEVPRADMSAAEIMLIRRMHGPDAVIDIKERFVKDEQPDEREFLKRRYCGASERRTKINFEQMFGPEHMPLPERLVDFAPKGKTKKAGAEVPIDQLAG